MDTDRFRTTMPHLTDFNAFLEELNKESDRGAALVSTSMIDDQLEKIILAFLIENKDTKKLLSGLNAPLGTFSTRIIGAYSLGLISEEEHDECNWLRLVRNEFAHHVHQKFSDQKVKDICANLRFAAKEIPAHPNLPRAQFLTSSTALILNLTNRAHYVSQKALLIPRRLHRSIRRTKKPILPLKKRLHISHRPELRRSRYRTSHNSFASAAYPLKTVQM